MYTIKMNILSSLTAYFSPTKTMENLSSADEEDEGISIAEFIHNRSQAREQISSEATPKLTTQRKCKTARNYNHNPSFYANEDDEDNEADEENDDEEDDEEDDDHNALLNETFDGTLSMREGWECLQEVLEYKNISTRAFFLQLIVNNESNTSRRSKTHQSRPLDGRSSDTW